MCKKGNRRKKAWNLIKNYRWRSVFFRYWGLLLILFLIPLVLMTLAIYWFYSGRVDNEIKNSVSLSFLKTKTTVERIFNELDTHYRVISTNNHAITLINKKQDFKYGTETSQLTERTYEIMGNAVSTFPYLDSIYLYSAVNNYVFSTRNTNSLELFYNREWYDYYQKNKQEKSIFFSCPSVGEPLISVLYTIPFSKNSDPDGILVVNIDLEKLNNVLYGKDVEEIFIIDESGNNIYASQREKIGISNTQFISFMNSYKAANDDFPEYINRKANNIFCVGRIENSGLYIMSAYPLSNFGNNVRNVGVVILICMILSVITSALFSFYSSIKFYDSIAEIVLQIDMPYIANKKVGEERADELRYISNNIMSMIDNNDKIEKELMKKMTLLKKAQSIALQTQINPHFLFNTLNLINVIIMRITKCDNEASKVVSLLSDILRSSLDTDNYLVSVQEEIEYSKKYLEIERVKTKNSFDIIWDIDQRAMSCKTVKLILQPLIENAIEHGFKPLRGRRGLIKIYVICQEGHLIFQLVDNGRGIATERLMELNQKLENDDLPDANHIGICNVNQRIKLIFGAQYGVRLNSGEGLTMVNVTLPLEE